uniref:Uncharacterized protein n=1 Tax=Arion vulgaris TaxID=1028688 RepID=A0A0B7BKZ4_9EUPU
MFQNAAYRIYHAVDLAWMPYQIHQSIIPFLVAYHNYRIHADSTNIIGCSRVTTHSPG